MTPSHFQSIAKKYPRLRIAVVGDFCLDRYLEIDPRRREISIETGLPVHNVVNVRSQPGAAGTILNNLVALGIGKIYPIGFAGEDGEGMELVRCLRGMKNVTLDYFLTTPERRTFTYTKPLMLEAGRAPRELNRLDFKNWSSTPAVVHNRLADCVRKVAGKVDAIILMDQVDVPETGVVTSKLLKMIGMIARAMPGLLILADSRRGLKGFPPVCLKMNRAELAASVGAKEKLSLKQITRATAALSLRQSRPVFVTLGRQGIVGAVGGQVEHVPALPVRGEIDIVGAGDSVAANLTAALAGGARLRESLEIANAAASIVIHQLGTTGTAGVREIKALLANQSP
ncbi:MAG TPA: PfkB family carbohydrate kinase [Verrucomicrobiae bacterium]|nr:PfkB family carbohydrate kinase [Verrucomicrobiae bacterium]